MSSKPLNVVVLISGNGSNLQALIDKSRDDTFIIQAVISNKADAFGLQRASSASIPTQLIKHTDFDSREAFDSVLQHHIEQHDPDLIVLAGFMRILSEGFVQHFKGRLINIHPSLLPKYPGTNTHQRVLDDDESHHGASVHFVTEELDGGPVIAHASFEINSEDSLESLKEKVHSLEHVLYPAVVSMFATGRLTMKDNSSFLDDALLASCGLSLSQLNS